MGASTEHKPGIAVYGASAPGIAGVYFDFARRLGELIAERGLRVVNGGGRAGLMGATIEGALSAGGEVTGVLPRFMIEKGWAHTGLTTTIVTETMHERKRTMAELSAGAIALPGGVGTLDELFEIITRRQLGLYTGGVVIANVDGFYDRMLAQMDYATEEHFMRGRGLYSVALTPEEALEQALHPAPLTILEKY